MRCVECGTETPEAAEVCLRCGAPGVRPWSVAADLAPAGAGDCLAAAPAGDTGSAFARIRRLQPYFMISLIFFLVLYMIGVAGFNMTQQSGLHHPMEWIIQISVGGALLSVVLFEAARRQFRVRQLLWGLVPILSLGLLAFVPFLWLALIRRQVRDWARFAVYLAAVVTATLLGTPGSQDAARLFLEIAAGLMVIAPLHTVVAFSPAAGVSSWREARAARDSGTRQQLVIEAARPEDLQ